VALDSEILAVAQQIGLAQLGTFHDRQGDQILVTGADWVPAGWARVIGLYTNQAQSGAADSSFHGNIAGAQAGHDIYAQENDGGQRDHLGVLIGYTHADGHVDGSVGGFLDTRAGNLSINANSAGVYWTHIGSAGGYTDTVIMANWFNATTDSIQNLHNDTHGKSFTVSLEGGKPFQLGDQLKLEPQAQMIWQRISADAFQDPVSSVAFTSSNAFTGRLGLRLEGDFLHNGQVWQPFLNANIWRNFSGTYNTIFAGTDAIPTYRASTAFELSGGVAAQVTKAVSLFSGVSYVTNLDGVHRRTVQGNFGVRIVWGGK
jgi:outer membrane autotransporter protein